MMAPAVRKAEMMGLDSMLHRKPSRSAPSIRYRIATRIVTCTIQHPYPQHSVCARSLGRKLPSLMSLEHNWEPLQPDMLHSWARRQLIMGRRGTVHALEINSHIFMRSVSCPNM